MSKKMVFRSEPLGECLHHRMDGSVVVDVPTVFADRFEYMDRGDPFMHTALYSDGFGVFLSVFPQSLVGYYARVMNYISPRGITPIHLLTTLPSWIPESMVYYLLGQCYRQLETGVSA